MQGDVSEEIEEFLLDHYKVIPEDNIGMSFLPFNPRFVTSRALETCRKGAFDSSAPETYIKRLC